jgi:hypothetical protein
MRSEAEFVASPEFRKGREWEEQLKTMLEGMGYTVIRNRELPDLLITDNTRALWLECKSKARMRKHPATGFSQHHYDRYMLTQELLGRPVIVAFNDVSEGQVYGNTLDALDRHIYDHFQDERTGQSIITFDCDKAFVALDEPANWRYLIDTILES